MLVLLHICVCLIFTFILLCCLYFVEIKRLFIPIRKVNTLNFLRPIQIHPLLGWALNLGTTVVHYLKRIFLMLKVYFITTIKMFFLLIFKDFMKINVYFV